MKGWPSRLISTSITKGQAKDSGMAVVLILLLIGFFTKEDIYFKFAAGALLMDMVFPMFYYPFAIFWFGLGNLLGAIVSKVLLLVVYMLVVMPIAVIRRMMGRDPLLLKQFKKGSHSIMKSRNYTFEATDLEKPF